MLTEISYQTNPKSPKTITNGIYLILFTKQRRPITIGVYISILLPPMKVHPITNGVYLSIVPPIKFNESSVPIKSILLIVQVPHHFSTITISCQYPYTPWTSRTFPWGMDHSLPLTHSLSPQLAKWRKAYPKYKKIASCYS